MGQTNMQVLTPEVRDSLPIFGLLGDQLPDKLKTPEAKKTGTKIIFWALLAALSYGFIKALPTLLAIAQKSVLLVGYAIVLVVLVGLFPQIVNLLHSAGRILLFKGEKALAANNFIETLELTLIDVANAQKEAHQKIKDVDASRLSMIDDGNTQSKESETKFDQLKTLVEQADELDVKAKKLEGEGNTEEANDCTRRANELRASAGLRKIEGQNAQELSRTYGQYANQVAKALEILKDNESSAKILYSTLDSSIKMIKAKLQMTDRVAKATQGLAEAFGIKDGWKFQIALQAANERVVNNVAQIRSNLELVSEGRMNTVGVAKSPDQLKLELKTFVGQLESGEIKKIDVKAISLASHKLTREEQPDKIIGSILD